jgi:hypothetical protein
MKHSVLERRVLDQIPEKYHQDVIREFDRYRMETSRVSEDEEKIGQATLTQNEITRAKTVNQHSLNKRGHTVVQLQAIKAAAIKYGVRDWLQHVDSTLSVKENIDIMRKEGKPTTKEMNNGY